LKERTAYYSRYSAVGAVLVASGRSGNWAESSRRICEARDNPDQLLCVLGEIYPESVMTDDWCKLKILFAQLLRTSENRLTYGYLWDLIVEYTEDKTHFRCHALSRLLVTLKTQKETYPTAIRGSRRALAMSV